VHARLLASGHAHRPPTGPAFDVVLLLHVTAVVVGLGAVVVSGVQAGRLWSFGRSSAGRAAPFPQSLREYFAPGVNWVARVLYAVPVFGVVLLALSSGRFGFGDAWVQAGLGLWVIATLVAEWLHWPAERRIQALVATGESGDIGEHGESGDSDAGGKQRAELLRTCRSVCVTATLLVGVLLAAIVLMVARP
jgi:hypothetical protein